MASSDDEPSGSAPRPPRQVVGAITPFDPRPSAIAAVRALAETHTPFALIGGLALEAWGMSRATKDLDLAVPVGAAELVAARLGSAGVEVRPLRIGGVALRSEALRIDLIDRRFHLAGLFRHAIDEAAHAGRVTRIGDLEVPLVSLEILLAMKMVSGEPKDDADVRRILRLAMLDYASARALVEEHLGFATANRLDAFAREAGRPEVSRAPYANGDLTEDD